MPIYEYHCNSCGKDFSLLKLSMSDTEATCPHCGSTDALKKLSSFCSVGGSSGSSGSGGGFSGGG